MRTVVVTGASTGIGRACALRLDRLGWRVFAGVRTAADAEALRSIASDALSTVLVDVTDPDAIASMVSEVASDVGRDGLHGLVNNAGIATGR